MLKSERKAGGTFSTPIKKIAGHVDKYDTLETENKFKQGETKTFVSLHMSNVQILEIDQGASHPYKVADIPIGNFSDWQGSGYVLFEDSIAESCGMSQDDVSIDVLVGKDIVIERIDNHLFGKAKDGSKEFRGTWWKVTSVGGQSAVSPIDTLLGMLDGQKKGDIIGAAVSNPVIKQDGALVQAILTGAIFSDQRVTNAFDIDAQEVFHKK